MKSLWKCTLSIVFSTILLCSVFSIPALAESTETVKSWYYGIDTGAWFDGGSYIEWHSESYKKTEIISGWEYVYQKEFGDLTNETLQKAFEKEKADWIDFAKSDSETLFWDYAQLPSNAEVGVSETKASTIYWYPSDNLQDCYTMLYSVDFDTGIFTYEDGHQAFPVYVQVPQKSFWERLCSLFL